MALTFANITTASSTTSSASLSSGAITIAATPPSALDGNRWVLVCASVDNAGPGGASAVNGVTDSAGNKYEELAVINHDPGAASAGITLAIYLAKLTNSLSAVQSDEIRLNFTTSVTSKAMTVQTITPGVGQRPYVIAVGSGVVGSATAFSAGAVTVRAGDYIVGATATEDTTAATADADTTNGTWSTAYTAAGSTGTVTTSAAITTQNKLVTATGTQTYNTSSGTTKDYAINYVILRESPEGNWAINGARAIP